MALRHPIGMFFFKIAVGRRQAVRYLGLKICCTLVKQVVPL